MQPLTPSWRETLAQRWPLWLACVLAAPLLVNRLAPAFLDADTVLLALMSTQKVTLFYWGQDRYANVLPLLLSPVWDVACNLAAHLWLDAAAWLLLLEAVSDLALQLTGQPPTRARRVRLFAMLVAVPLLVLRPFALYQFAVAGQPYALSFCLLLLAGALWRRRARVACALVLVAALGINPSLVLTVPALMAFQAWRGQARAWLGFAALVGLAFGLWTVLSRTYPLHSPSSYLELAPRGFVSALLVSVADIRNHAIFPRNFIGLSLLAALLWWRLPVPPVPRALAVAVVLAMTVGFVMWLFFLTNRWVQDNNAVFRYFMPLLMAPLLALAVALARVADGVPRLRSGLACVCLAVFLLFALRPPRPFADYHAFAAAAPTVQLVQEHHVRYLAGDYWTVWPAIFTLQRAGTPPFGAFSRGIALQAEIVAALAADRAAGRTPTVLCVHKPVPTCQEQLRKVTGLEWPRVEPLPQAEFALLRL